MAALPLLSTTTKLTTKSMHFTHRWAFSHHQISLLYKGFKMIRYQGSLTADMFALLATLLRNFHLDNSCHLYAWAKCGFLCIIESILFFFCFQMASQNLGAGQGVGEIPYLQYSLQSGYLPYPPQQQLGPSVATQRQSGQFTCSDPFRQSLCVPSLVVPAPLPSKSQQIFLVYYSLCFQQPETHLAGWQLLCSGISKRKSKK